MLITRAPARMISMMAVASSSGAALSVCRLARIVSPKIGRRRSVQLGQIAGAGEPLLACSIPATKVPWVHAPLSVSAQAAVGLPDISRIFSLARSGWFTATGPSIKPIQISFLPLLFSIKGVRFTKPKAPMGFCDVPRGGDIGPSGADACIIDLEIRREKSYFVYSLGDHLSREFCSADQGIVLWARPKAHRLFGIWFCIRRVELELQCLVLRPYRSNLRTSISPLSW